MREFDVARGGVVRVKPNIFLDYFLDRVRAVRGKDKTGEHFIAVTDPGSPLESRAKKLSFAQIFYGIPPDRRALFRVVEVRLGTGCGGGT